MINKFKIITIGTLSMIILIGCGTKQVPITHKTNPNRTKMYPITYNTNPEGASVVCNGVHKGYSPVTLWYKVDENTIKTGKLHTIPCTANWISGAKKDFINIWDLNRFPDSVMQTLQRPNVEGYEKDAQFALQVRNMKYQKRQAQAAESAASSAAYQNTQNMNRNYQMQKLNNQLQNMQNMNRNYQMQQQNYRNLNINNYMRY
jgi:hypothetical protein